MKIKNYILTVFLFTSSLVFSQTGTLIIDSIISDGVQRLFRLYIPTAYSSANAVPLVLNLHGYTSNALQQESYGDFRKIADTAHFIIVHAQGLPTSGSSLGWTNFFPVSSPNNDLQFLSNLIDTISSRYSIDLNRVYSTGMSNGGFMSYDLACFLSNKIAAIASVTGSMASSHFSACNPQHPMPIMEIHGTADAVVRYDGTAGMLNGTPTGPCTAVQTMLDYWVNFNNCNTTATFNAVLNTNLTDNCTAEQYVYVGGDDGSTVEHYKIIGGGHSWPGAPFNINITNMDFNASKEIWRFFSQHALATGVNEQTLKENNFSIYPNPSNGVFTVELRNNLTVEIKIVNVIGEPVFEEKISNSLTIINLNNTADGIYFYELKNPEGTIVYGKLIVE